MADQIDTVVRAAHLEALNSAIVGDGCIGQPTAAEREEIYWRVLRERLGAAVEAREAAQ